MPDEIGQNTQWFYCLKHAHGGTGGRLQGDGPARPVPGPGVRRRRAGDASASGSSGRSPRTTAGATADPARVRPNGSAAGGIGAARSASGAPPGGIRTVGRMAGAPSLRAPEVQRHRCLRPRCAGRSGTGPRPGRSRFPGSAGTGCAVDLGPGQCAAARGVHPELVGQRVGLRPGARRRVQRQADVGPSKANRRSPSPPGAVGGARAGRHQHPAADVVGELRP